MMPQEPGKYWARDVSIDMLGNRLLSLPYKVNVVADIPNPRGHKLLVETGLNAPKFRGLGCYEFGAPSVSEIEMLQSFANQFAT